MSASPSPEAGLEPRRRLAAVWFIDIAGYTAMAWRDESTALAIVQLFQQRVRSIVADHGGRLVKFIGDEALAEFISADAAVRSALEIVADFRRVTHERGTPADVRAGVHVGDLFTGGDGDIYGSGVNLTSRIQGAAAPGDVVVSEDVWRLIRSQSAFAFAALGERRLKGFPAPVGLYRVRSRALEPDPAPDPVGAGVLRIAFRPLVDATAGSLEYLALGLTEEIAGALRRVEGLRVTVSPSGPVPTIPPEAEDDDSPDAVLAGRLRAEGDRVGAEVELSRIDSGEPVWRASRELARAEIPEFHRDVVRWVVEALHVPLPGGAIPDPPEGRHRPDPEAHDFYLRGRHHWKRHSREDLDRSVACFERALEIDPDYALAHAGLADAWLTLGALFLPPRESYPRAKAAATRALVLDEHLGEAHAALAEARLRFDWDRPAAERGFQHALELRPDYGEAQRMYANFLRDVGRFEEAIVVARRAEVLDPVSPPIRAAVAGVLYYARRYEECVEEVDRILESSPWFFQPMFYRALSLERLGQYDEAAATFQRLSRLSGLPSTVAGEAYVRAAMGQEAEALNLLARLEEVARTRYVPAYSFASVHVALGDLDAAFGWFGRAVEERSSWMVSIGAEPRFDSIREDSRFTELLRATGVADAEAGSRGNLRAELTPTIGRGREADELERILRSGSPLVTLTGPPGTGKTRLALHVARRSMARYPDGVWLAELNPMREAGRVMPEVARTLGVSEKPGEDLVSTIAGFLEGRRLLLVTDGMEGVLDCGPLLSDLLSQSPGCQVLATSRAPLRLRGEREYPVPPLGMPADATLDGVEGSAAVHLFVDRARSVRPAFELDSRNAAHVAEVCRRLDGLPLAIELAAVRVRLMDPAEMLRWLDDRMGFLTVGHRDLPEHQKTLRAAFDWSHDLLSADQRALLRSLAVFAGGFSLDAAVAVGGRPESSAVAMEALSVLVDNSLVRRIEIPGGGVRYAMLETVREYAALRLKEAGEEESARMRHARWILSLGERAEERLEGPEQAVWLDLLEREHGNVEAALDWLLESGRTEMAVRIASALWRFWWIRGHFSQMRPRLEQALKESDRLPPDLRANLLVASGALASSDGDQARAVEILERAVGLERAAGSPGGGFSRALVALGFGLSLRGEHERAIVFFEEALAFERERKNDPGTAVALRALGKSQSRTGDLEGATRRFEEALQIDRRLADSQSMAFDLSGLARIAHLGGDERRAEDLYRRALELNREIGSKPGIAYVLADLAQFERKRGRTARAREHLGEALGLLVEIGNKRRIASCLASLAEMSIEAGEPDQAAHLVGFLHALRDRNGVPLPPEADARLAEVERGLIGAPAEEAWKRSRAAGANFTLSQGIHFALESAGAAAPG